VPILNVALLIKAVLVSDATAEFVFLTLLSSAAYAGLAILLAARVFQQEQVLLGGKQSIAYLLGFDRRPGRRPGPMLAMVSFAVILVAVFYSSVLLERAGTVVTLLVTEYGFFLLPTLLFVAWFGFGWRDTLSLRVPPVRALVGSALIGLSAWTIAAGLLIRLLPPPDSLTRALEKILLLDRTSVPLGVVWLIVAVTPAICEELYFRGFALSGLRRLGPVAAIGLSALLFGLAHSSIYRLLPTVVLGVLFGFAVWRTGSIACSILGHALNNGVTVTMIYVPQHFAWLGVGQGTFLPWTTTVLGCAVAALGVLLILSVPQVKGERGEIQESGVVVSSQ